MKRLIYFSASWCAPCKTFKPIMTSVSQKIPVEFVDIDNNPGLADKFNVKSIPTVILIDNGREVKRFMGVKHENVVIEFFNS